MVANFDFDKLLPLIAHECYYYALNAMTFELVIILCRLQYSHHLGLFVSLWYRNPQSPF